MKRGARWFATGFLFAALQYGEFLLVNLFFSSAVVAYFGVTLAWLLGSALGFTVGRVMAWRGQLACQVAGFAILSALVGRAPADNWMLLLYGLCVALTGLGVGHFFRRNGDTVIQTLLWRENDGFVVGIPCVFAAYLSVGRPGIYGLVAAALIIVASLESAD